MSVGADKAYDTREFVATLREMNIRAHVPQNSNRAGGQLVVTQAIALGRRR